MNIEWLIEKFSEHAKKTEEERQIWIKNWKENNPGKELPEEFSDGFNLPEALGLMCSEILKIKNKLP